MPDDLDALLAACQARVMPPAVAAANASTSTPNRSRLFRTPTVAPLMANAKVPT